MKKGNKTITIKEGRLKCPRCDDNNLIRIGNREEEIIYKCQNKECGCYPVMTILGAGKNRLPVWSNTKDNTHNPLGKPLINA